MTENTNERYVIEYQRNGLHKFSSCLLADIAEYMHKEGLKYDDLSNFQVIISDINLIRKMYPDSSLL